MPRPVTSPVPRPTKRRRPAKRFDVDHTVVLPTTYRTIEHAEQIVNVFVKAGITAEIITAAAPFKVRITATEAAAERHRDHLEAATILHHLTTSRRTRRGR